MKVPPDHHQKWNIFFINRHSDTHSHACRLSQSLLERWTLRLYPLIFHTQLWLPPNTAPTPPVPKRRVRNSRGFAKKTHTHTHTHTQTHFIHTYTRSMLHTGSMAVWRCGLCLGWLITLTDAPKQAMCWKTGLVLMTTSKSGLDGVVPDEVIPLV